MDTQSTLHDFDRSAKQLKTNNVVARLLLSRTLTKKQRRILNRAWWREFFKSKGSSRLANDTI